MKVLDSTKWLTVKEMMKPNVPVLHVDDSFLTAIAFLHDSRLGTLPVADEDDKLIGVLPSKRLYRALLEGADLYDPIREYLIYKPVYVYDDLTYDEVSLVIRVTRSKVDHVIVVDHNHRIVGIIGTAEYLRGGINVINKNNTLMESLFNANNESVIVVDKAGVILRVNSAFEGTFGINNANLKGKPLDEVLPEVTIMNKRLLGVKKVIKSVPVIVNQMPILDNGVWIGTVISLLDLSDLEEMAQELELVKRMQEILENVVRVASDGVIVVNKHGDIEFVNQKAGDLFQKSVDELKGRPAHTIIKGNELQRAMESGIPEVSEYSFDKTKGVIYYVPIKQEIDNGYTINGVIMNVYLGENLAQREEIANKLLSLSKQVSYYKEALEMNGPGSNFDKMVSKNIRFNQIKEDAKRISRSASTVLITGESGVGKDMFARAIHASSPRARHSFIKVNCAAIPESLLESELFGYAPGSFTGASKSGKPGYFELADKGTIFLDEIGDMPLSIQAKILQVLQEKQFMRVGGTHAQSVDVRIIAATNRHLKQAIAEGTFRQDLYYRLNVIEFSLPALRERKEDILPLAYSFIEKYNEILGCHVSGIIPEAGQTLLHYSWPGNIRELENAIERAANYVWMGEIGIEHLPAHIIREDMVKPKSNSYRLTLSDLDKKIIETALLEAKGNKSAAARSLNMSRSAFYDRLNKYNIN